MIAEGFNWGMYFLGVFVGLCIMAPVWVVCIRRWTR